jgi:GDP-L-fucose synthase
MFSDDFASALLFVADTYDSDDLINIGTGEDVSIIELSELMRQVTGFNGQIEWNRDIPDGTPRKLLDVSKLHALGWRHKYTLLQGLELTYSWFRENYDQARLSVNIIK